MSQIKFYKYHGTGNDFIVIDNRIKIFPVKNYKLVEQLCDRRFGIGADGLLLLNTSKKYDFDMGYYNANGKPGSMCGNGARCIIYFAHKSGIRKKQFVFTAPDGLHESTLVSENKKKNSSLVKVKMSDVNEIKNIGKDLFLDTGSPHYIRFVNDASKIDVFEEGRKIRYSKPFVTNGTNVNFVAVKNNTIFIRTYERGVENETLACGTGVTAAAIAAVATNKINQTSKIKVQALGGTLFVYLKKKESVFEEVYLEGEAQEVYEGSITI